VPPDVHEAADVRVRIPIVETARSLNVAIAGAMVLGEALRQLSRFPGQGQRHYE
jgi:tRNA (cytidine/uridine-2'-O-)-methyltransferase